MAVDLVTASDIADWSGRLGSRGLLPDLVQRLVVGSPGISLTQVDFPAGEGIAKHGADGLVESKGRHPFVPSGESLWELSVNAGATQKANADYKKRTKETSEEVRKGTTYVALTGRRWDAKKWAKTKSDAKEWKAVKAVDADLLYTWLLSVPSAHLWLTEQIKRPPSGARSLRGVWSSLRERSNPPLTPAIVVAGRDDKAKWLAAWLGGPAGAVGVATSSDRDLGAVLAAVAELEEIGGVVDRTVLVSTPEAWDHFASSLTPLILISTVPDVDTARAVANGHHVLLPMADQLAGGGSSESLDLGKPRRMPMAEALREAGVPSDRSYELAGIARRSTPAFLRIISTDPSVSTPAWAQSANRRALTALFLAGSWIEENEADTAVIDTLSDEAVELVPRLRELRRLADSPARFHNGVWYVTSKEDLWRVAVGGDLLKADLERLSEAALSVFTEVNPARELEASQRHAAQVHGKVRAWSSHLRDGLADSLAFLGSLDGDVRTSDGSQISPFITGTVAKILKWANEDTSIDRWASLDDVLSLFAEAAPDELLSACLSASSGASPLFALLFEDQDKSGSIFTQFSPHSTVQNALERVAWNPQLLPSAAIVLARLANIDPGGYWSNRPAESLENMFREAFAWSDAPTDQKLAVIDRITQDFPDVAWKFLSGICLDGPHRSYMLPSAARWRSWGEVGAEPRRDPAYEGQLLERLMTLWSGTPDRVVQTVKRLSILPRTIQLSVLDALVSDTYGLSPEQESEIAEELRNFQYFEPKRRGDKADETVERAEQVVAALTGKDPIDGNLWLFGLWPRLASSFGHEENYETELADLRLTAVREILDTLGNDGVRTVAQRAENPNAVGFTLFTALDSVDLTGLATDLLESNDPKEVGAGQGFVWAISGRPDPKVAPVDLVRQNTQLSSSAVSAMFAAMALTPELYELLAAKDEEVQKLYWARVDTRNIHEDVDPSMATRALIDHDRSEAALDYLMTRRHRQKSAQPSSLVLLALNAMLDNPNPERWRGGMMSFQVSTLLADASQDESVPDDDFMRLELNFLPWLEENRRNDEAKTPLRMHRKLASDPAFFAEAIATCYRSDAADESDEQGAEDNDAARAQVATSVYRLLKSWKLLPGTKVGGGVDVKVLKEWIEQSRQLFAASGHSRIGDSNIGEILSHAPHGADGGWPCEPVRDVIDAVESDDLEEGFEIGRRNQRGVTSRAMFAGGSQETELAAEYEQYAAIASAWPRTRASLQRIAESYRWQASRIDAKTELEEDKR